MKNVWLIGKMCASTEQTNKALWHIRMQLVDLKGRRSICVSHNSSSHNCSQISVLFSHSKCWHYQNLRIFRYTFMCLVGVTLCGKCFGYHSIKGESNRSQVESTSKYVFGFICLLLPCCISSAYVELGSYIVTSTNHTFLQYFQDLIVSSECYWTFFVSFLLMSDHTNN